jgi:hypothetical protein
MYKIIGIDGQQYGPVTNEQIKQWIAANRVNAETMAQAEGSADWKPLSTFSEFADAFSAKSATSTGASNVQAPLPAALQTTSAVPCTGIDVANCLGRAWDKTVANLWPSIGVTALIWLALSASHAVYVGIVITGPLLGGLTFYYLKQIRNRSPELQDAFAGFTNSFLQLMLVSIVSGALIAVGLALCLIPGIYLAVAWVFALPLIIDKQLGFWEAMELSRKTVNQCWWSAAWLLLVCGLINMGGALLCVVGVFFTLPLTGLALTYAYEDVFAAQAAKSP